MLQDRGNRPADRREGSGPLRVLLIEAEPRAALWIGEMLRACWPEPLIIAHAERLDDALADIAGTPAGCIVLDVARPQYGWLDEVEQLRKDAAEVPIVVLADNSDDESAIAALRVFEEVYVMTGGGPVYSTYTVFYYMFDQAFGSLHLGYAAAVGVVLAAVTIGLSVVNFRLLRRGGLAYY